MKNFATFLYSIFVLATTTIAADILTFSNFQTKISTAQDWENIARPQVLKFFEDEVYGQIPPRPNRLEFELVESSDDALGGIAKRRQYKIISTDKNGTHSFVVLLYLPKKNGEKIPAFVCSNFWGNYSVSDESQVFLPKHKIHGGRIFPVKDSDRGVRGGRIPVRDIVSRGYAIATFCYCDVFPDYKNRDASSESIYKIFDQSTFSQKLAIAAWAWGYIRTRDLLETLPEIDQTKVAIAGHSRLAKTSIYASANDTRFNLLCANGGGAKSLRLLPNLRFKFWFSQKLKKYVENEFTGGSLKEVEERAKSKPNPPFDQYSLIACVAPRAVYLPTADGDIYASPETNFKAVKEIEPVFALYGAKDFVPNDKILSPTPHFGDIAYHCKKGTHSITPEDWKNFLDYADKINKK